MTAQLRDRDVSYLKEKSQVPLQCQDEPVSSQPIPQSPDNFLCDMGANSVHMEIQSVLWFVIFCCHQKGSYMCEHTEFKAILILVLMRLFLTGFQGGGGQWQFETNLD